MFVGHSTCKKVSNLQNPKWKFRIREIPQAENDNFEKFQNLRPPLYWNVYMYGIVSHLEPGAKEKSENSLR